MCVWPGRAAICGWEWTRVGWTEGTLVVTGWSPTAEEEEEVVMVEGRGEEREAAEGASWGPGMAVVGMTVEEREGVEEEDGGETDGRSEGTSPVVREEEVGEERRGAAWAGGGEVSIAGGTLAAGSGAEGAATAGAV